MSEEGSSRVPRSNPLLARLYTDSMTSTKKTTGGRPVTLSLSRSQPTLRKTHELIVQHNLQKNDSIAYGGIVQRAIQQKLSPTKDKQILQDTTGHTASVDRAIRFDDSTSSTTVSEQPLLTFLESIELTPKERFDLQHVPQFFLYLRMKTSESPDQNVPRSVYNLETVTQDKLDKNAYFTMSKEGITQFSKDSSHFTPFAQWEREFKIFRRMSRIRFFKLYKRWKVSHPHYRKAY